MVVEEPDRPPRITAVKRRPRGRVAITTSDGETLTIHAEALERAEVCEGDPLDGRARERVETEEHRCLAHEAALRLLSYRPRSERELGQRLRLRGIPPEIAEAEVGRLRKAGLLDDEAFAHSYVGGRQESAPRGQRLLRYELLGRGIRAEIADEAVSSIDDRTAALALARGRAPRLAALEYGQFSRRLGGFLQRRGFGYADVEEAVRTVWNENAPEAERR
jgi:regulatory protein